MSGALLAGLAGGALLIVALLSRSDRRSPHPGHVFSPYGPRGGRLHEGADYEAREGDPVRTPWAGQVVRVQSKERWAQREPGPGRDAGAYVEIAHPSRGLVTRYLHLEDTPVNVGQLVAAGDVIGTIGRTGVQSSRTHLHFEVRVLQPDGSYGASVDPALYRLTNA